MAGVGVGWVACELLQRDALVVDARDCEEKNEVNHPNGAATGPGAEREAFARDALPRTGAPAVPGRDATPADQAAVQIRDADGRATR